MCGIAGYSLSSDSGIERTLAAQALLAGIAERGADAVGYAFRAPGEGAAAVAKQRSGASEILDRIGVPAAATQVLLHVRDYTKGHPSIPANNHPVRHGPVVGVHNGIITNDDELLAVHPCARAEDGMSVDSEAIFALAAHAPGDARALERLRGSMATAWIDERLSDVVFLARGVGRPLWIGSSPRETFFASTRVALEVAERYARVQLRKRELVEGTLVVVENGRVVQQQRFTPDVAYVEADPLPSVRAPHEGAFCLQRLAALAAA
jgi:glucosamine 6-phosphate synthetase-like amidotransferase/phosphosugar isomerase protein